MKLIKELNEGLSNFYEIKFYPRGTRTAKWVTIKAKDIKTARNIANSKYENIERVDRLIDLDKHGFDYKLNVVRSSNNREWKPVVKEEQRELDLDEKNLNVQAAKLHQEFTKPKFNGFFVRKPESWEDVLSFNDHKNGPIELDDLFDVVNPDVVQDLEFSEKEVYGGEFNQPLKNFTKNFLAKGLDAFFVNTRYGMFAVRTEGAEYARYAASIADEASK